MSIRFVAATSAALMLVLSQASHAQSASAPAADAAKAAIAAASSAVAAAATSASSAAAKGDATEGKIAYYGRKFAGRKTASGERFNPNAMTMAHPSLPFGTLVKVTNVKTSKSVTLRVNDRGPKGGTRIADVSFAAAKKLRMLRSGVVDAKLEVVGQAAKGTGRHHHHAKKK